MSKKFIISTDSCVDHFRSYLEERNVHYIILKRITNGVVTEELYDSEEEYHNFYSEIKKGALPTTSQLNPFELAEHFSGIMDKEPDGDLIHISLSSGLSETWQSAVNAASQVNEDLSGRKIHVIDSLSATSGMAMLVDRLVEMRDEGVDAEEAVRRIEHLRNHQQVWAIIGNLFHLKRGGRLSGFKAAVGTLLKVKPILVINRQGKLVIEQSKKGEKLAIDYVIDKMSEMGEKAGTDFSKSAVYVVHSAADELCGRLEQAVKERFGNIKIKRGMIGPIIGTHVGDGTVAVIFEGAERLDL